MAAGIDGEVRRMQNGERRPCAPLDGSRLDSVRTQTKTTTAHTLDTLAQAGRRGGRASPRSWQRRSLSCAGRKRAGQGGGNGDLGFVHGCTGAYLT